MAIAEAMKEAIWLISLVGNLGLEQDVMVIYCYSQSTINLTKNQIYHERTKHINIRYHFIYEIISQGAIVVKNIGTSNNPVDILTNSITIAKFKQCLNLIGIYSM